MIKEINIQITRSLGGFEFVKLGAVASYDDTLFGGVESQMKEIKMELDKAFESLFKKEDFVQETPLSKREVVEVNTPLFDNIKAALHTKRADMETIEQSYILSEEIKKLLLITKNK